MTNLTDSKNSINYKSLYTSEDFGQVTLIKLPVSSVVIATSLKNFIIFRGNKELNEISKMRKTISLYSTKNVVFHYKIILTLGFPMEITFRLYINGKDDNLNMIDVNREMIINQESIYSKKLPAGDYIVELMYISSTNGECNMQLNDWDIISLNILILDLD